ncbi:zinc finger, CCHC-type containing protein [Tanacetum coccineum]
MVNSMLSYSGLNQGFWDEAMLTTCYLLNWVPNKRNRITPYELWTKRKPNPNYLRVWGCRVVVRLPDPKLKTLGKKGIECVFVRYAEHSKAFRFYVIKRNESVLINSIIESRDAIFDENRFSSVPRPSLGISNETKYFGGSVVPQEVTEEVVTQQPESKLRKGKRNRTPKNFRPEFQLYLIEGTMDEVVAFWKKAINDEMDSIMGNNTWVLADLPPCCKHLGFKWIFKRKLKMDMKTAFLNGELDEVYMNQPQGFIMPKNENKVCKLIKSLYGLKQAPKQWHQKFDEVVLSNGYLLNQADKCVDLTNKFLSSKFSMKDMGEADVILVSTPMDTSEKLMPNNGQAVSQLEYSRVIGCLMYAMTCTRPDIAFVVGKLSRYTSNPGTHHWQAIQHVLKYLRKTMDYSLTYTGYPSVLEGYTDASWISNTEDNSSTNGWVFLLGGGVISWASKKQTCITGLTIESKFVALAAAGKETEWLKNLLLEIPLWSKPIAPISIRCDSAATLAKAYSHLADHLTKGLARDLVLKFVEGMGLKSN